MDERGHVDESQDSFAQDGPGLFENTPANPASAASPSAGRATTGEPLALYRRYRPEVFADVIGQEHVTEPLKRALANNRVNHAYLFSGPRGCGKTSSARILARSLNCEQGPTPDPCGVCQSCRDLGRGGPGSIDVLEIDAASHGGVDDARDLRERAQYAPVQSRYRIYIVDEAHMVSSAGFNALLKLVEEPPPHVKFIFATTEPDKVIGTIRSRTHHYPFRLIPPKTMTAYLTRICEEEHVGVEAGVLPMVVRAGGGSVRDSLSILDQLFGGAPDTGVGYAQAAALLGYTPDSLLDDIVDAIAASDSRGVFSGIDKVVETGQDPRRFAEDLLTRLRDLVIVAAVPDAITSGLLEIPADQAERFTLQAKMGVGTLTRAAEVIASGLVGMRGTTAPRMQLELMCARILLPGADAGERGLHARLERVERRLNMSDSSVGAEPAASAEVPVRPVAPVVGAGAPERADDRGASDRGASAGPVGSGVVGSGPAGSGRVGSGAAGSGARGSGSTGSSSMGSGAAGLGMTGSAAAGSGPRATGQYPRPQVVPPIPGSEPVPPSRPTGDLTTEDIRRSWPQILARVSAARRYVWMIVKQYATVTELRGTALWLTFSEAGPRDNFNQAGGEDNLAQAIHDELGARLMVRARLESEPIPADGKTAILSVAKPAGAQAGGVPSGGVQPAGVPATGAPTAATPAGGLRSGSTRSAAAQPGDTDPTHPAPAVVPIPAEVPIPAVVPIPAEAPPAAPPLAPADPTVPTAPTPHDLPSPTGGTDIPDTPDTAAGEPPLPEGEPPTQTGEPPSPEGESAARAGEIVTQMGESPTQPGGPSSPPIPPQNPAPTPDPIPTATAIPTATPTATATDPGTPALTRTPAARKSTSSRSKVKPAPPPADEDDLPSADDEIIENPIDQAEELVMELFGAELVQEETTRPRTPRKP